MTNSQKPNGETSENSEDRPEPLLKPLNRRKFLQRSITAAAGGTLLAYSVPTVLLAGQTEVQAPAASTNCDQVDELLSALNEFPFSPTSLALISDPALGPIAGKMCAGVKLDASECDFINSHGWLPAAEVNLAEDSTVKDLFSQVMNVHPSAWYMKPDNQDERPPISCGLFNHRVRNLTARCPTMCEGTRVYGAAFIAIGAALAIVGTLTKGCTAPR